jgi:hypothetical protein
VALVQHLQFTSVQSLTTIESKKSKKCALDVSVGNTGKTTPKNDEQTQSYVGQSTAYTQMHTHPRAHKAHKSARKASKLLPAGLVGGRPRGMDGGSCGAGPASHSTHSE